MKQRITTFFLIIIFVATAQQLIGKDLPQYIGSKTTAEIMNAPLSILNSNMPHRSLPQVGLNFTAATEASFIFPSNALPNATGAVGETQYILSTYGIIQSFNKITGEPDGVLNIDMGTFFGGAIADPRIDYDRFAKRWYLSGEYANLSTFLPYILVLAVSSDSTITPSTQWSFYQISLGQLNPNPNALSMDYEQSAVDQNAYYNGVDIFDDTGAFLGSTLTVIQKSSLLAGSPNIITFPGLFPVDALNGEGFACPANNFDSNPEFGYFVWCVYDQPAAISGNTILLYRILNAATTTPILGPLVTITLDQSFAFNALWCPHKGNLFPVVGLLQNGFGRLWTPHVRNHQLYLAQDIQIDNAGNASTTGDRIGVRWYQFDLTGDPSGKGTYVETESTIPVLIQSGTLYDNSPTNPLFYFNASIMSNKQGDIIITADVSGVNAYIDAVYAYHAANDLAGTLQTPVPVTRTNFPCNFNNDINFGQPGPNIQRWGDESAAVTDPSNDLDFWLTQQFAAVQNAYGIQVTQVIPAS